MILNRKGLKKEKYQMKMKETVKQIKKFTFLKNFEDYRLRNFKIHSNVKIQGNYKYSSSSNIMWQLV